VRPHSSRHERLNVQVALVVRLVVIRQWTDCELVHGTSSLSPRCALVAFARGRPSPALERGRRRALGLLLCLRRPRAGRLEALDLPADLPRPVRSLSLGCLELLSVGVHIVRSYLKHRSARPHSRPPGAQRILPVDPWLAPFLHTF